MLPMELLQRRFVTATKIVTEFRRRLVPFLGVGMGCPGGLSGTFPMAGLPRVLGAKNHRHRGWRSHDC